MFNKAFADFSFDWCCAPDCVQPIRPHHHCYVHDISTSIVRSRGTDRFLISDRVSLVVLMSRCAVGNLTSDLKIGRNIGPAIKRKDFRRSLQFVIAELEASALRPASRAARAGPLSHASAYPLINSTSATKGLVSARATLAEERVATKAEPTLANTSLRLYFNIGIFSVIMRGHNHPWIVSFAVPPGGAGQRFIERRQSIAFFRGVTTLSSWTQ